MTDKDYLSSMEFKVVGEALLPTNQNAIDLVHRSQGKTVSFTENTQRDLKFHKAYFSLLRFTYQWLPNKFKGAVSSKFFYQWLKHLQGKYKVLFEFKDGSKMINYDSISFSRMSQGKFQEYVRTQLTVIYEDVIHAMYDDETSNKIIDTIEYEFENYLDRL